MIACSATRLMHRMPNRAVLAVNAPLGPLGTCHMDLRRLQNGRIFSWTSGVMHCLIPHPNGSKSRAQMLCIASHAIQRLKYFRHMMCYMFNAYWVIPCLDGIQMKMNQALLYIKQLMVMIKAPQLMHMMKP